MSKTIRYLLLAMTGFVAFTVVQYPAARAGDILYGVDFSDQLLQINPTTGAGTVIGPLDSHMFAYGLGVTGGNLYTYDQVADVVRQLDPATGHTLATINIGTTGLIGEGDITFNSAGTGYLSTAGTGGLNILSFDLAKGTNTVIGPQSVTSFMDGLAFRTSSSPDACVRIRREDKCDAITQVGNQFSAAARQFPGDAPRSLRES